MRMVQVACRVDTHQNAFRDLKKAPSSLDHCLSDFSPTSNRGLDETLVVMCGEMGRTRGSRRSRR